MKVSLMLTSRGRNFDQGGKARRGWSYSSGRCVNTRIKGSNASKVDANEKKVHTASVELPTARNTGSKTGKLVEKRFMKIQLNYQAFIRFPAPILGALSFHETLVEESCVRLQFSRRLTKTASIVLCTTVVALTTARHLYYCSPALLRSQ